MNETKVTEPTQEFVSSADTYKVYPTLNILHVFVRYMQFMDFCIFKFAKNLQSINR